MSWWVVLFTEANCIFLSIPHVSWKTILRTWLHTYKLNKKLALEFFLMFWRLFCKRAVIYEAKRVLTTGSSCKDDQKPLLGSERRVDGRWLQNRRLHRSSNLETNTNIIISNKGVGNAVIELYVLFLRIWMIPSLFSRSYRKKKHVAQVINIHICF